MDERSAQAQVIAQLTDGVRRREAREAHIGELRRVQLVVRGEDRGLIVRVPVGAEERGRHEHEVTRVEAVSVVCERQGEVADGHADCRVR